MKINIKKKLKSAGSTIKEMGSIDKKSLKNGSYSMGITAIVIAVLVVINLIVGQIPEKYKNLIVRVWGFSAYFTALDEELQNEMINRNRAH